MATLSRQNYTESDSDSEDDLQYTSSIHSKHNENDDDYNNDDDIGMDQSSSLFSTQNLTKEVLMVSTGDEIRFTRSLYGSIMNATDETAGRLGQEDDENLKNLNFMNGNHPDHLLKMNEEELIDNDDDEVIETGENERRHDEYSNREENVVEYDKEVYTFPVEIQTEDYMRFLTENDKEKLEEAKDASMPSVVQYPTISHNHLSSQSRVHYDDNALDDGDVIEFSSSDMYPDVQAHQENILNMLCGDTEEEQAEENVRMDTGVDAEHLNESSLSSPLMDDVSSESFCVIDRDETGDLVYKTEKEYDELNQMYSICTNYTSFKTFEHLFQFETVDEVSEAMEDFFHTLCTCEAQAPYLNGFLLNEREILQSFKSQEYSNGDDRPDSSFSINHSGSFYDLMKKYYDVLIHQAIPASAKWEDQKELTKKWTDHPYERFYSLSSKTFESPACYCIDKKRLTKKIQVTIANLNNKELSDFRDELERARDFFSKQLYSAECSFTCCKLAVNHFIQTVVAKRDDRGLRQCISILFEFERLTHSGSDQEKDEDDYMVRFRNHVRMCTRKCVASLLKDSTNVDDHRFIIFNVVQTKHVSQWGSEFLQISDMKNDQCVDVFLAELSMYLTPVFDPQSNQLILTEEDYIKLWEQIPFFDFADYLLVKSKRIYGSSFSSWLITFNVMETTLYILSKALQLFNIDTHKNFARRIGHTIVRYVQICTCILFDDSVMRENIEHSAQINQLYDNFFVKSFYSLLRTNVELGLWSFLIQLPYDHLSQYTIAALFYNVLTINMDDVKDITFSSMISFKDWNQFVQESSLRIHFAKQIGDLENRNKVSSPWFYILPVVAKIASYSSSINFAAIIAQELFLVGFINQETRQMYYRDVCTAISRICDRHVDILSMLITLMDQFSKNNQQHKAYIHLFKSCVMQIRRWEPSISDIQILSEWLQHPLDSVMFRAATFIIENLSWPREQSNAFVISSFTQRSICLSVVEALNFHTSKNPKRGWLRGNLGNHVSFEEFCLKIVFQAKLQTSTGVPIINFESMSHPSLSIIYQNSCRAANETNVLTTISCYLMLLLADECSDFSRMKSETNIVRCMEQVIRESPPVGIRFFIELGSKFCTSTTDIVDEQLTQCFEILNQQEMHASYFSAVSKMVSRNQVGYVTKKFVQAVDRIMESDYDRSLISLFWIKQVTRIPKWWENENYSYIADKICMNLILKQLINQEVGSALLTNMPDWCIAEKAPTSFLFFDGRDKFFPKGVFDRLTYEKNRPYLALMFSLAKIQEESILRMRVYDSLHKSSSTSMQFIHYNMEQKKSILLQVLKSTDSQPHDFVIYRLLVFAVRYSQDILAMEKKSQERKEFIHAYVHTSLPIFWQLFFSLYFEAFQVGQDRLLYGSTFLGIDTEETFLRRVSELLRDLSVYYAKSANKSSTGDPVVSRLASLYQTMSYWLSPEMEFSLSLNQVSRLPTKFDPKLLDSLIHRASLWYDTIDMKHLNNSQDIQELDSVFPKTGISVSSTTPIAQVLDLESLKKQESNLIQHPAFDENIVEVRSNTSFKLNKFLTGLKDVNKEYQALIDSTRTLDQQYIEDAKKLIRNVQQQMKVSIKCGVMCKGAGYAEFHALSMKKDENKYLLMARNRVNWLKYMQCQSLSHARDSACSAIIDLASTIEFMMERDQQDGCVDIFFQLLSNFEVIVQQFPPIKDPLFYHLLKPIADTIVKNNRAYTRDFMNIILKSNVEQRIYWFADLFDPMCCSQQWDALLSILGSYVDDYKLPLVYPLIARFDKKKWLTLHPDMSEQKLHSYLKLCIKICLRRGITSKSKPHLAEQENLAFKFFLDFLSDIVLLHGNFETYYQLLQSTLAQFTSSAKVLPGVLDLLNLTSLCFRNKSLTFDELCRVFRLLENVLNQIRTNTKKYVYNFFDLSAVESLLEVISAAAKSTHIQVNNEEAVHSFFTLLCTLFKHFIFQEGEQYPFNLEANPVPPEATLAFQYFLGILDHFRSPLMQNEVWKLFISQHLVKCNPRYLSFLMDNLLNSSWDLLEINNMDQLHLMISMMRPSNSLISEPERELLSDIVSRIQWPNVDFFYGNDEEAMEYHKLLSTLFAQVIIRNNKDRNERISNCIAVIKWAENVSPEVFNAVLQEYITLMMEFNIKMKDSAQVSIDCLFQILQGFVQPEERRSIGFNIDGNPNRYMDTKATKNAILIVYMKFLLHLFSLILSKKDHDGELYIYLDQNKEGLYQYCVSMVLQQPDSTDLLVEMVKVFNVCQIQLPAFAPLNQLVLKSIMHENDSELCLRVLSIGCQIVGLSDQLAILCEACIRVQIEGESMRSMQAPTDWVRVAEALMFNDVAHESFISSCVKQGCVCSLYAIAKKELVLGRDMLSILTVINSWIRSIDMLNKNQIVLMSLQKQALKVHAHEHQDDYFALLLKLHLDLMKIDNRSSMKLNAGDMIAFVEALIKIYTGESQSTWSAISQWFVAQWSSSENEDANLKKFSKHSQHMRFLCIILATFLAKKLPLSATMLTGPVSENPKWTTLPQISALNKYLVDVAKQGEQAGEAVKVVKAFMDDETKHVGHSSELFDQIVKFLEK